MISRCKLALCLIALVTFGFSSVANAQSIIRQPGDHPDYSLEIEPHLAFQWSGRYVNGDAFGPGVRFNIPLVRNGFVRTINNNVAITFGLDITFGDGDRNWCYNRYRYGCSDTEFWLPVAMQWNFFLTKVISVFGEPGFAIVHRRWSYDACDRNVVPECRNSYTDTGLDVVFAGGGRFMFSDKVGATVRLGSPAITAGINILL